jgi:class 3 adenylate cyclase/predicted ATPase
VDCASCGESNPEEARFCMSCGVPLRRTCGGCGATVQDAARFCSQCGLRLAPEAGGEPAAPKLEGERRQLTVLFCDLIDSTRLAGRLDPEDLRTAVRAYQHSCEEVVRELGGHVAQYLGDGVLVYFGYPRTFEDTASRALRAALGILESMPQVNRRVAELLPGSGERLLQVRIGIHTGPVVVGEMGSQDQAQALALGQTVNLAARLQEAAPADGVVVSEETRRLLDDGFELEPIGEQEIKGIGEPVTVHRVLGLRQQQPGRDAGPVASSQLIGREQEVALLLDRWEQVKDGSGQVVLVRGEAGIGKSRLVTVARKAIAQERAVWLEGRCSIYFENSPLHPVLEFMNQALFLPTDDDGEKIAKLEAALDSAGLDPREMVPLFCRLLSIPVVAPHVPSPLSAEAQRHRILESLDTWLLHLAAGQPVCLVVEDVHWVDPSTQELLRLFFEKVRAARVLLVLTARPGFETDWAEGGDLLQLSLNRLTRRQVGQLVEEFTHGKPLPTEVLAQIVRKTDGVPLFVEELTKMVIESGLVREVDGRFELASALLDLAIPSTLYDSLMARLDRLGPAKELAQLASVLGRSFPRQLLEAVFDGDPRRVGVALDELVEAELIQRSAPEPHAEFSFRHALIQDVAYQSLLKSRRQRVHRRVAETLEAAFPERAKEMPEAVARHFEEASATHRAVEWYHRAGDVAGERSAHLEAVAHLRHGLALLRDTPDSDTRKSQELQLQVALGKPLMAIEGYGSHAVQTAFARARELGQELREDDLLFRATWGLGAYYQARGDLDTARALALELLAMAELRGDATLELLANVTAGATAYYRGEWALAISHLEHALALYDPARHQTLTPGYGQDPGVIAGVFAGIARCHRGAPDRGLAEADRVLREAREAGAHPLVVAFALDFLAVLHFLRREPEAVMQRTEEAIAIGEQYGFVLEHRLGQLLLGWARCVRGEEEGLVLAQEAIGALSATGAVVGAPMFVGLLAETQAAAGEREDALRTIESGIHFADGLDAHFWDAELERQRGVLLLERDGPGDDEAAGAHFAAAVKLAEEHGSLWLALRAATSRAGWLSRHGRASEAREAVRAALSALDDGETTQDGRDAHAWLAA